MDTENGKLLWKAKGRKNFTGDSFIDVNRIYIASEKLYSLNIKNGRVMWESIINGNSPKVIGNYIYLFDNDVFYKIDKELEKESIVFKFWEDVTSDFSLTDGKVYFASDQTIYSYDIETGRKAWAYKIQMPQRVIRSSPVFYNDKVYVGSPDSSLYVLDGNSGKLDKYYANSRGPINSTPAVSDDVVFFGSYRERLAATFFAFDIQTNKIKWDYPLKKDVFKISSPVASHNNVYFYDDVINNNVIYCLNKSDGSEAWKFETRANITTDLVIRDGTLYYGDDKGYVYSLF